MKKIFLKRFFTTVLAFIYCLVMLKGLSIFAINNYSSQTEGVSVASKLKNTEDLINTITSGKRLSSLMLAAAKKQNSVPYSTGAEVKIEVSYEITPLVEKTDASGVVTSMEWADNINSDKIYSVSSNLEVEESLTKDIISSLLYNSSADMILHNQNTPVVYYVLRIGVVSSYSQMQNRSEHNNNHFKTKVTSEEVYTLFINPNNSSGALNIEQVFAGYIDIENDLEQTTILNHKSIGEGYKTEYKLYLGNDLAEVKGSREVISDSSHIETFLLKSQYYLIFGNYSSSIYNIGQGEDSTLADAIKNLVRATHDGNMAVVDVPEEPSSSSESSNSSSSQSESSDKSSNSSSSQSESSDKSSNSSSESEKEETSSNKSSSSGVHEPSDLSSKKNSSSDSSKEESSEKSNKESELKAEKDALASLANKTTGGSTSSKSDLPVTPVTTDNKNLTSSNPNEYTNLLTDMNKDNFSYIKQENSDLIKDKSTLKYIFIIITILLIAVAIPLIWKFIDHKKENDYIS